MTKYSKIRLQVSVLRTNGPLVGIYLRSQVSIYRTIGPLLFFLQENAFTDRSTPTTVLFLMDQFDIIPT